MHNQFCNHCPDWMDDKNRFQPENRFVGDIEDGKRYPFDVYKKSEADERFAVKQTETDLQTLTARVETLEYNGIKITSFTADPTVCELGSSNTILLSWALNKTPTEQNINGTPVSGNSAQFTDVTSDTTYTLNVLDGNMHDAASVTINFANRIYFGAAANLSDIAALDSVVSDNPARTINVNAGVNEHIIYALPVRLGKVALYSSGIEGGFEEPVLQVLTNSYGYQETYLIYRSTNANLGQTTIEVKER